MAENSLWNIASKAAAKAAAFVDNAMQETVISHVKRILETGFIRLPEDAVLKEMQRSCAKSGVQVDSFVCRDGYAVVDFHTTTSCIVHHALRTELRVDKFLLTEQVQQSRLCFSDELEPISTIAYCFAQLLGKAIVPPAAQLDELHEKTKGVVDVTWPVATIHLGMLPVIERANRWGVFGLAEIRACHIVPGAMQFVVKRPRSTPDTQS